MFGIQTKMKNNKVNRIMFTAKVSPPKNQVEKALYAYLNGERDRFCFAVEYDATPFQKDVYAATRKIPYGETRSYGWVAEQIGKPNASRAVGQALNKNPLPLYIPCHRVIGKNHKLVGFGSGLDKKRYLLNLESSFKARFNHED